ncbi:hypothetical protein [Streptomyces sp. NPDC006856]
MARPLWTGTICIGLVTPAGKKSASAKESTTCTASTGKWGPSWQGIDP